METYRLKIKIGPHEFEAEGATDVVQAQFQAFKDLLALAPTENSTQPPLASSQKQSDNTTSANETGVALDRIARVEERVVSLTVKPETIEDALMLLLLGQRTFRGNDSVTGSEIILGLRQSGYTVTRVDWRLERLASAGHIMKIGSGRASRYRLTNVGLSKAQAIAKAMLSIVP